MIPFKVYYVVGVVQTYRDGVWSETPTHAHIRAASPEEAKQNVLDQWRGDVVRWHTPELVQVREWDTRHV